MGTWVSWGQTNDEAGSEEFSWHADPLDDPQLSEFERENSWPVTSGLRFGCVVTVVVELNVGGGRIDDGDALINGGSRSCGVGNKGGDRAEKDTSRKLQGTIHGLSVGVSPYN